MGGASYGHDLHGAVYSGHARRGAEAADKLLRAGAGLMDPMGICNREPERERSMAFGRALDVLIEIAELRGMPASEIIDLLEEDVADWRRDFGGHRELSEHRRAEVQAMTEGIEHRREDPVESGADVSWKEYDEFIDSLVKDTHRPGGRRYAVEYLAKIARHEARMRKQAQDEAAELRGKGINN